MSIALTTARGISLLDTKSITGMILQIERLFPGWWWSISHSIKNDPDTIRLSMGPSRSCRSPASRHFLSTKKGDSGIHVNLPMQSIDTHLNLHLTTVFKIEAEAIEIAKKESFFGTLIPMSENTRRMNEKESMEFRYIWDKLLKLLSHENIHSPEKMGVNYQLCEIYLGSCHTSVDVSLRGIGPGGEFDITVDIPGNSKLDEVLNAAMQDYVYMSENNLLIR